MAEDRLTGLHCLHLAIAIETYWAPQCSRLMPIRQKVPAKRHCGRPNRPTWQEAMPVSNDRHLRSMFSVVDNDSQRTASHLGSSGRPVHGAVLRRYISLVPSTHFVASTSRGVTASAAIGLTAVVTRLFSSIASRLWPADSSVHTVKHSSAGLVSGRFTSSGVKSDRVPHYCLYYYCY